MSNSTPKFVYIILSFIILFGLQLRLQTIRYTIVDNPIRADASGYLMYALNLKVFNIYSQSTTAILGEESKPQPDAIRTPGYPLFLRLFIRETISNNTLYEIELTQALLSTLTIFLTYLTFSKLFNQKSALIVALLTAISPHLVFTNVFILSEGLSCFLLMLFLWSLSCWKTNTSPWLILCTGIFLALTSLTRPWTQYFIIWLIPFMVFCSPVNKAKTSAAFFCAGFLLPILFWVGRNIITLGFITDNTVTLNTFYQGHYPDLMYDNRPETFAYPYRFDPRCSGNFRFVFFSLVRNYTRI